MSDEKYKDIEGVHASVVGRAGGPMEVKTFKNGSQAQLKIAVNTGYKNKTTDEWVSTGTNWYTLTAKTEYAEENWPDIEKGDKVRVDDATLELKGYLKNDGTPEVDATLRWGTLVIVEKKSTDKVETVKAPW